MRPRRRPAHGGHPPRRAAAPRALRRPARPCCEPGDLLVVNTSATRRPPRSARAGADGGRGRRPLRRTPCRASPARSGGSSSCGRRGGAAPLRGRAGERLDLDGGAVLELAVPVRRRPAPVARAPRRGGGAAALAAHLARHGRPDPLRPRGGRAGRSRTTRRPSRCSPGSAEMPSAARPFTPELVTRLVAGGVLVAPVTLHAGVSSPERHERPAPSATRCPAHDRAAGQRRARLGRPRRRRRHDRGPRAGDRRRRRDGHVRAGDGWTDLVVTPERGLRAVDGLLTGWHEPEASHLQPARGRRRARAAGPLLPRGARRAATSGTSSATATSCCRERGPAPRTPTVRPMGFLDALLGKRKLKAAAPDRLFALSTAYVDLQAEQGITTKGSAAIVFQPLATSDFESIVTDMQEVVGGVGGETGTTLETHDDEYGYRWMVLRDPDLEDLVVGVNAVSDALAVGGYQDRVLCAVFAFADARAQPLYFIYNYKRGSWYPFVPPAASSSARPSASCRSRRRWAPACRSSPSSSAGSPSGASRSRPPARPPARPAGHAGRPGRPRGGRRPRPPRRSRAPRRGSPPRPSRRRPTRPAAAPTARRRGRAARAARHPGSRRRSRAAPRGRARRRRRSARATG